MVLANQQTIIDYLMNQQPVRNTTPVISTANKDDILLAESHRSIDPSADLHHPSEVTLAELEVLKKSKKKGTKDAHFAVMLLKSTQRPRNV